MMVVLPDIVSRLRSGVPSVPAMRDGADVIEDLRRENAALREYLKGIAAVHRAHKMTASADAIEQFLAEHSSGNSK